MTKQQIVEALKSATVERDQTIRMTVQVRDLIIRELTPEEAEIEGDPCAGYWWVCPECHGHIKQGTRFCMSCGKEIIWK